MLSNQPRGYQFGKRSEMILASFIEKWNDDVNLSFHHNDRNICISVDKNYYPTKVTGIDILHQTILRVAAVHKSLPVAQAQVGTMMQRRGAITELGEFRRKDHSPDVLSCPSHADSVSTSPPTSSSSVALRCWSVQREIHGNLKQEFDIKYLLKSFVIGVVAERAGGQ